MNPASNIISQLEAQNIEFNILQMGYNPDKSSPVSKVVAQWKKKFIAQRKAPHLDAYLWHIFSFGSTQSISGEAATNEYSMCGDTTILIFNEPQQYLIECVNSIPRIEMDDFFDDIYIVAKNMEWTYVIPHEIPHIGPFFSTGQPNFEQAE